MSDDAERERQNVSPIVRFGVPQLPRIPLPALDLASQWARTNADLLENIRKIAIAAAPSARMLENVRAMSQMVDTQAASV